jgi:hypothetical protein
LPEEAVPMVIPPQGGREEEEQGGKAGAKQM